MTLFKNNVAIIIKEEDEDVYIAGLQYKTFFLEDPNKLQKLYKPFSKRALDRLSALPIDAVQFRRFYIRVIKKYSKVVEYKVSISYSDIEDTDVEKYLAMSLQELIDINSGITGFYIE